MFTGYKMEEKRTRYQIDPEFRERKKEIQRMWFKKKCEDPEFREKHKRYCKAYYAVSKQARQLIFS